MVTEPGSGFRLIARARGVRLFKGILRFRHVRVWTPVGVEAGRYVVFGDSSSVNSSDLILHEVRTKDARRKDSGARMNSKRLQHANTHSRIEARRRTASGMQVRRLQARQARALEDSKRFCQLFPLIPISQLLSQSHSEAGKLSLNPKP